MVPVPDAQHLAVPSTGRRLPKAVIAQRRRATAGARGQLAHVLLARRVRPQTLAIYQDAARQLRDWCLQHRLPLFPRKARDCSVTKYLDNLFLDGESVN